MKRLLLLFLIMLTGCMVYGEGKSYGYITTVESGIFWDKVWFRASLESSNTECWILDKSDYGLKDELQGYAIDGERVEITYARHFIAMQDGCWDDEIISARPIKPISNE